MFLHIANWGVIRVSLLKLMEEPSTQITEWLTIPHGCRNTTLSRCWVTHENCLGSIITHYGQKNYENLNMWNFIVRVTFDPWPISAYCWATSRSLYCSCKERRRHVDTNFAIRMHERSQLSTTCLCLKMFPLYITKSIHKKEKRVSNCTIPAYKHSLCSTKYTCVCLVLHSDLLRIKTAVQKYSRWP